MKKSYSRAQLLQTTKLLANVKLKFLSWNMANTLILFAEKMWVAFAAKIINIFENTLATTVYEFVINKLIKLTMLWTTGPGLSPQL